MNKFLLLLALGLSMASAFSQSAIANSGLAPSVKVEDERSLIQAERARLEAGYQTEEAACYARFTVTDCIRQLRERRRKTLDKLRHQEVAINDAERKRKALEEIERIKENSSTQRMEEDAARRAEARKAQQEREENSRQKAADLVKARSAPVANKTTQKNAVPARTATEMATERQQYEDKIKDAQEHRASREKTNKENTGTPSKPLPEAP